ncbi:MAG: hypothetical protein ACREL7_09515 [Longimicrobiales bacterium]
MQCRRCVSVAKTATAGLLIVFAFGACHDASTLMAPDHTTFRASVVTASSISGSFAPPELVTSVSTRHGAFVCSPLTAGVEINGTVQLTLEDNGAVMVGLLDKTFLDSGTDPQWGSGAYIYFGRRGTNMVAGPSDGFLGGELVQNFTTLPYVAGATHNFTLKIRADGKIEVLFNSATIIDDYGQIKDANSFTAYAHAEFQNGAYIGADRFPDTNTASYTLNIVSGCITADDDGPLAVNVAATPNPAAATTAVTVTADIDDTTTGEAVIASAEYSLDGGATWNAMSAADGVFDEVIESVTAGITAPADAGLYALCVRGTDGHGNTGDASCTTLVTFDPSGGFVTGGGFINSQAGAIPPVTTLVWDQGFQTDAAGWFGAGAGGWGTVSHVGDTGPDGSPGIANMTGDAAAGPFSRFDGYRSTWTGTWTAEIDVFLDPAWSAGEGFDYSVAASGSDGLHQRDYIFHVTKDASSNALFVAGSNNTNFAPRQDLETIPHYEVTSAGWYTFQHVFRDQGGSLAVDLNLLDASGNVLFTETRFTAADIIATEIGGNRYSWFTFISVASGISVDNHQLFFPVASTASGKAQFGFVAKYKKGASMPEGNTQFTFQAGGIDLHSTSYDWLVVNQGGSNAHFKGEATVNGVPGYRFMLWAGDGNGPNGEDTFRIRIWQDAGSGEDVQYDNAMNQPIAGGNIIVHPGK